MNCGYFQGRIYDAMENSQSIIIYLMVVNLVIFELVGVGLCKTNIVVMSNQRLQKLVKSVSQNTASGSRWLPLSKRRNETLFPSMMTMLWGKRVISIKQIYLKILRPPCCGYYQSFQLPILASIVPILPIVVPIFATQASYHQPPTHWYLQEHLAHIL